MKARLAVQLDQYFDIDQKKTTLAIMKELIDYIKYYVKLSVEAEEAIQENFKLRTYVKDEIILREGDVCKNLFFILEGTVRTFYLHDGKDVTTWIYPNGFFITAWTSFLLKKESFESIQAIEASHVAYLPKTTLYELYDKYPSIERFGRYLAEEQLAAIDEYSKGYMFQTAKEKYDNLLAFFPDVVQRANLGYIASMLGISQETLSRLRNERS